MNDQINNLTVLLFFGFSLFLCWLSYENHQKRQAAERRALQRRERDEKIAEAVLKLPPGQLSAWECARAQAIVDLKNERIKAIRAQNSSLTILLAVIGVVIGVAILFAQLGPH